MIGFQFYAAGTFQFLIILVQGAILFAKGANRSEHFARRLTLDLLGLFLISLPLTLGYWRIDQAAGSAVLSNSAIVVLYLTLYLLTAAMLKRCFQLSCRSCLMAAATGYVCQHIFYEIRLIVNVLLKLDVALYAAVGWPAGFWVSFFLELAMAEGVLFLLHRLFGQRAAAFSLDDASSSDVTLMIVATLGLVLIVNAFLNIYASESQALAMMVRALLTIACLFILLLRAGFLKSGHLQSELEVLSRLHEQERRHYEHLKENMEAISIKCHDIKHFISSRMARAGIDNEELSELVRIYDTRIKTGNDTIDVLLSEQSLVCQRRNIRVTVLADASGLSFIGTTDICSLFGNLLENAVEAEEKIEDERKRVINVEIRPVADQIFLCVENYCAATPEMRQGLPVTSKGDAQRHGFGMKSIQAITEKYGGVLSCTLDQDIFRVSILFPAQ